MQPEKKGWRSAVGRLEITISKAHYALLLTLKGSFIILASSAPYQNILLNA
jgi:hypothetical protein